MKEFKFNEFKFNEFKLKEETKMLTFEEFRDKRRIVLVKPLSTYIMQRNDDGRWSVFDIFNGESYNNFSCSFYSMTMAYEFYHERMISFDHKQFPVIIE